ncbi:MAG: hypothetical protein IJZ83_05670 [Clostridia bacterium]|nr:hypothetical protein [Clostridia bacterium]
MLEIKKYQSPAVTVMRFDTEEILLDIVNSSAEEKRLSWEKEEVTE